MNYAVLLVYKALKKLTTRSCVPTGRVIHRRGEYGIHQGAFNRASFLLAIAFCTFAPVPFLSEEKPSKASKPHLVFFPEQLDLGKIPQHSKKSFDLFLVNRGNADLVISNVTGACGCTATLMSDKVIKPGSRGKLQVTYDSETASGSIKEAVVVDSNDPDGPVKQYIFSAYVIPAK